MPSSTISRRHPQKTDLITPVESQPKSALFSQDPRIIFKQCAHLSSYSTHRHQVDEYTMRLAHLVFMSGLLVSPIRDHAER
jgi:hypothetical protein